MIPPHLFYQIYLSFLEQNDCTPPKCGELSEYTDSAHTEVEDLSSRYMNGSNVNHFVAIPDWRKEMLYLTTHSNTFYLRLYGVGNMVKDHSDSERGNPLPPHGLLFRLAARVLLYASSRRQDNTYHGLCYTSRGALAGRRNSSMGPPHEGSIRRAIAPWANALATELHLAPLYPNET